MHPTDEHLLPWYVAAGAGGREFPALRLHDGVTLGSLAMDAYAFGPRHRHWRQHCKRAAPQCRCDAARFADDPAPGAARQRPGAGRGGRRFLPPQPRGARCLESTTDEATFSVAGQRQQLAETAGAAVAGTRIGWWLFAPNEPAVAIGQVHFSQIVLRAFCSAMLGYAIDTTHEGRGLMTEALQAALADAFGPRVRLHRVQANVRPENTRSLALLERLGFEREGLAREYLFIDGAWRDHVMTARRNPDWPPGTPPPPG